MVYTAVQDARDIEMEAGTGAEASTEACAAWSLQPRAEVGGMMS